MMMKKVTFHLRFFLKRILDFLSSDDDDDENKREKKTRPTRHTDANRRRNNESSAARPRQLAQEYQKPVRDFVDSFYSSFRFVFN